MQNLFLGRAEAIGKTIKWLLAVAETNIQLVIHNAQKP